MALNPEGTNLLDAFRLHFNRFQDAVAAIIQNPTDAVVVARLGDDLDEFLRLVQQNSQIFEPAELETIRTSLVAMQTDDFLWWAYSQRSTASIARFLGVSRNTVRTALLDYGIATPQSNPFPANSSHDSPPTSDDADSDSDNDDDDLLNPELPIPAHLPPAVESERISDDDLDSLILRLRSHFRRADGHRVPRERVRQSLLRIDPVRRIFERIRIRRRVYSVPGPNSLWHHDGQHGTLRALESFHIAYLFTTSVHNVRIERLWVDITAQLGATWAERFTVLELRHGLDINNISHIWLLHFLFLATINSQLAFFAQSWNQHRIQIRDGPNRSPADMFVFDMLANGVRGNQLPAEEVLSEEELEVYGIDWAGLRDDDLLASQRTNNPMGEGASSWVGRVGPPPLGDLSSVVVEPPAGLGLILFSQAPTRIGIGIPSTAWELTLWSGWEWD
ncbi:hypothetical protein DFH06DRAFT_1272399 [Mycena polygramma]|nr:hypothetical protein DFH06DRAFT_1272399 [Mycena polygramma]